MKKKLFAVGLCLTLASAMALTACSVGGHTDGNALKASTDVYGMGAVSTVKLLNSAMPAQSVRALSAVRTLDADGDLSSEDEVKEQVQRFNEYFTALDSFLGEDVVSTVCESNDDEQYPYETKMTICGRDVNGESVVYVMYYTETLLESRSEEDGHDWDETESEYALEGVMALDGVDYYLEGKRSCEQEQDETENELKIRAYADREDRKNYIEMKQETEQDGRENETEYVYGIYVDGKLAEQTAVKFETERQGERETTEYELEFRQGKNKGKYEIVRKAENDVVSITVKYDLDGKKGEFRIRETVDENGEKQYEYTFSDKSKKVLK